MAVPEILMLKGEFRTIPSPVEARVGLISYQWGFALRSDDSCFAKSDLSLGPIHSRSSGCGGCLSLSTEHERGRRTHEQLDCWYWLHRELPDLRR